MFGERAATPPPPPLPDPLPSPPSYASGGARPAGAANKIPSYGGTLLTQPGATLTSNSTRKSLLGQ